MFCPEGYITMAEIVRKFEGSLFQGVLHKFKTRRNDLHDFFSTSPMDELEDIVFNFIEGNAFIASPEGMISTLDTLNINGAARISTKELYFRGANVDLSLDFANTFKLSTLPPDRFSKAYRDQLKAPDSYNPWEFAAATGEANCNHLLPMYFERCGYTISLKGFDYIKNIETSKVERFINTANIIRPFEGWPICVSEQFASEKNMKSECDKWLKLNPAPQPHPRVQAAAPQVQSGRPRKRDLAAKDYRRVFPTGHGNKTWKAVLAEIENETGNSYTIDTLKRGLRLKK
ncbi:hypothetical protein [Kiloniella sp.]|uniref:hypothetical protein n=1 Tax=Kiloniella sp. TaxID=1938587 RepID=UPI003B01060A